MFQESEGERWLAPDAPAARANAAGRGQVLNSCIASQTQPRRAIIGPDLMSYFKT
jgi:hypothetical protein